jgi:hypothetical protein
MLFFSSGGEMNTCLHRQRVFAVALLCFVAVALMDGCGFTRNANVSSNAVAAPPAFTPASGTSFSSTLSVSITDDTPGATIYFTTNGSTPSTSSPVYSGPFTISATSTVNAIASAGGVQSTMASASYTLSGGSSPAATPTFTPASGTSFSSTLSVSIADTTPGATIYYTTNGSTPTTSSSVYSGPITVSATTTVNAIATASGFSQSAVGSANYTLAGAPAPAATPTFTPVSGTTFSSTLSVSIADATPGATIYYTTNGSAPTTSSSVYSGPITVSATTTVNAIATASGFSQSAVGTASYTLASAPSPAATPTLSPATGTTFSSTLSVSIADATPGATIYYTTNGTTPTTSSPVYSGAFNISASTTVNAIAVATGYTQSAVGSASYTLTGASTPVATPTFTPASGATFSSTSSVSIADTTPGAIIYYTTNGTTPTTSSSVYSGPITISATTTINAIATAKGYTQSALATASYTLVAGSSTAATPVFTPASGTTFSSTLSVSIVDTTPGATIYYTTNGAAPTTSSAVYSGPISVSATTTVMAIAAASGYTPSAVGSATYTLNPPAATPVFTPVSGTTFASTLSVSIADSTPGATIYYTTNGATPTTSSAVYSGPINLSATTTVKAIATASSSSQSAVGSATYTLNPPAATPVFTPVSGTTFSSTLSVSIADSTPGATIYYTTNGTTPTTSSAVYSGPINLSATTTVKAIATATNFGQSAVGSATYTLNAPAATPVFTPVSGTTFSSTLSVSIADSTPGATIYYTTNGTTPTTSSAVYSGPISISATTTVKAIATASNSSQSAVGSATYTLNPPAATPVFTPASGTTFSSTLSVSIADSTPGATIYYTTNGTTPTTSSSVYSGPISISATTTINAIATAANFGQSAVGSSTYTLNPPAATPTFNPVSGTTFSSTLSVSIADSTPGATIYYTTNGTTPTTSSTVYSGPISLSATTTVKAIATAANFGQSAVGSATYTLNPPAATPTFNPVSGTTFSSTLSVSIADSTPGATIYYTTNGTAPTTSSTVYSGPITLSATTTINAIASASGFAQSAVASASYTDTSASTGGIVSDNFDEGALNASLWTTENPLGDGTVTMNGSAVTLNVPLATVHNLTTGGDNTLRVVQPIANPQTFSVDVRFQSVPEIGNQDEGILVEQDSGDFLRFDVFYNGTTGPELFAEGITGTTSTTFISTQISLPKAPLVLRLARNGNAWTGSWSTDGTNFTAAPSFTFDLNVASIGPYAGNYASTATNSPAFTALVDYFFATSNPIANQDGPSPYGWVTVDANPAGTVVEKTLADIQGTGHLDPVTGEEFETNDGNGVESGLYWYEYPASGNLNDPWIKHTIIGSGDAYEDMVAYDVNGDGAVDIICSFDPTFQGNYELVWFENPRGSGGDPTQPWTMHIIGPPEGADENNLTMADIDGDGKIDIISPEFIYFQNSADSWTPVQYSTSFRGDAVLDIGSGLGAINLVGTQPTGALSAVWYENPRETGGNARTGKWIMHTIGPGYPCTTETCPPAAGIQPAAYNTLDVNGDGRMDVISSQSEGPGPIDQSPPPGGLYWWEAPADRRNGTWVKHLMDYNMIDVHKIDLADMDKNGTTDIVVEEQDQSFLDRVVVFYNDGKGNLTENVISNAKGHNDAVGDVIGNGALDIFNSGHGFFNDSHPLQIFLNPY